jgi:predicted component of type VI protein secretion system
MSTATVNHAALQKAFLLLMSATVPGEAMAARDAVLRLTRSDPRDLAVWFTRSPLASDVKRMAEKAWNWFMWNDYRDLSNEEEAFVQSMLEEDNPTIQQAWRMESLFARTKEEENV